MNRLRTMSAGVTRRGFLKATLAAGVRRGCAAHVLGSAGQPGPSDKLALGVIGVGPGHV